MPKITYVQHDDTEHVVDIDSGTTVMQAAVDNNIAGIDGDCGGQCACATCHVYVGEQWLEKAGNPTDSEEGMLSTVVDRRPNSRLSCQIKMDETLDGLLVRLPSSQH